MEAPLRIGFVPEHFSTPLRLAIDCFSLHAELVPFLSGTGHIVTAMREGSIDVGVGLTEGWVMGLGSGKGKTKKEEKERERQMEREFKIVGTYVESPLQWSINTGATRDSLTTSKDLQHTRVGVSRLGSGSHIMAFVLAEQEGWLTSTSTSTSPSSPAVSDPNSKISPYESLIPCGPFPDLRTAVSDPSGNPQADFFLWEHFTSSRYFAPGYDQKDALKSLGDISSPWGASWLIVAQSSLLLTPSSSSPSLKQEIDPRLENLFTTLDTSITYFNAHIPEMITYISTTMDYSREDVETWIETVRFAGKEGGGTRGVDRKVVERAWGVLRDVGVLDDDGEEKEGIEGMVGLWRG
ncbi:MAG: hypothetical protein M1817_000543 [Caeruleum heppii]|nr:MAG: hypothetical protein M1817_000543 [Caeruleum heppii]